MMNKKIKAINFASRMHKKQIRKHAEEPYIVHPLIVAEICEEFTDDLDTIIAAILHDTIEDTDATYEYITRKFGENVSNLVYFCTEKSKKSDGNRKLRKKIDCEYYCSGPDGSKLIKVADAIHNCMGIAMDDPSFFEDVYLNEKIMMVQAIMDAVTSDNPVYVLGEHFIEMAGNWSEFGSFKSKFIGA